MRPYKTNPVIVERVWGGSRLCGYNKSIQGSTIGESWETGSLEGDTPVLIKLIDARETLSVQVHPDDEFAFKIENEKNGKSEAWVVLECSEDAFIIYGFNRPVEKAEIMSLLGKGSIAEVLNYVKVRKGDCIYIPAGTVHSLGKGILAYEVQQPSDLTYRIYDWDRKDLQGKSRELHVDKAAEAINYSAKLPQITNIYNSLKDNFINIINCKHFESSYRCLKHKEFQSYEPGRFRAFTTISGSVVLRFEDSLILAHKGDTIIIPEEYDRTVSIEGLEAAEYIVTACNI
ncbi:MAG TPA: class I mannose-6-phosphate isomerase [Clostridia bacterium]|nr:class I mannose-6-phosphate isomerase [Clostridia bacterium]